MDTQKSREAVQEVVVPLRRARDRKQRVADLIVQALVEMGVDTVFGIPGGSIGPVYDALLDEKRIRVVTTRHETSAVFAAAAFAQLTGRIGVVLVTSGPGVLNAMNGLGSAMTDSLPVVVIAGEAAREGFGRGAVQDGSVYGLNIVGMASHVTKWAFELTAPEAAPAMLERAVDVAMSGRKGPVLMSAPLNALSGRITRPRLSIAAEASSEVVLPNLEPARRALASADRKVILAGAGARDAAPQLLALAERLACPVMTTPKAKGVFPESHPLSLGVFGMGGHPSTSAFIEAGIDVLVVAGSSLNEVATNGWSPTLMPRRTLIHIDVDATALGRVYPADIGILASADVALDALLVGLEPAPATRLSGGIEYAYDPGTLEVMGGNRIAAPRALHELQRHLPEDAIYTVDSGSNLFFAIHYLRIDRPDSFVSFLGLGSMGSGLPAALGAQLAHPARQVVAILGDGGYSMVAAELATIAASKLPVVVAVLNDGGYGMVEFGMKATFGRNPSFPMTPFDVVGAAASCGAEAVRITRIEDIGPALAAAPADRPLVLDIHIEPHVGLPTNKRFQQITRSTESLCN